jgi:hypothetical protein
MDLFSVLKLTSFQIAAVEYFLIAGVLIKLLRLVRPTMQVLNWCSLNNEVI